MPILRKRAKKGRRRYFRIGIPADLSAYFGRVEVWRSPQTDDPALTKLRETQWRAHLGTLLAHLRREGPAMSRDQIAAALVPEYLSSQVSEIEERLAVPMEEAARDQREEELREEEWRLHACLRDGNLSDVEATARGFLPTLTNKRCGYSPAPSWRPERSAPRRDSGDERTDFPANDAVESSPASVLRFVEEGDPQGKRVPFTDDELRAFFKGRKGARLCAGKSLKEAAGDNPAKYWVPLTMAFQGCRLEEPAQLDVADVKTVQGVPCIEFNTEGDKKLKTTASQRTVPIHPRLIELGFLEYVQSIGEGHLFPSLRKTGNGYGDAVSKWANRRLRAVGIKNKRSVLYSLRHTFSDRLTDAEVPAYLIAALMGHADSSMTTGRYGAKKRPAALLRVLTKLRLPI